MDTKPAERVSLQLSGDKKLPEPKPAPPGATLEEQVIAALRGIYDPEIPVNIYELGLVYDIDADPATGKIGIRMTLTTPACPVAGSLPGEVQARVQSIPGVTSAQVDLVWDPPWDKNMMSDAAKLQLGMFD
jgi:FeS assembly SUF system protein